MKRSSLTADNYFFPFVTFKKLKKKKRRFIQTASIRIIGRIFCYKIRELIQDNKTVIFELYWLLEFLGILGFH